MSLFSCPVCGAPLCRDEHCYHCKSGHSFDIARQGYVHLLTPDRMHAKIPGDNKEMVASRARFLASGSYALFSDGICRLTHSLLSGIPSPILLDAGCGEGYYTARLAAYLREQGLAPRMAGVDISKFAVKEAAKRAGGIEYAVASIFALPVPNHSVDFVLNVFAPIVPQEFNRVLRPGGHLLIAVAGERHLYGLKEVLYERPYENEKKDTEYPGFSFVSRTPIRGEMALEGPLIQDLFSMTPYYWKTDPAGAARLASLQRLTTEIGFDLLLYKAFTERTAD